MAKDDLSLNKKRLAKNTIFLYFRMLLVMAVTFFTTRVILEKLGVEDYGIYNTIAGIVVMFGFINKAMITTTQRFLNYYLGKQDYEGARKNFSQSLLVHFAIALLMIGLSEAIGLWFLYKKMSLPADRFDAAFWTLQISIAITFFNILRTPYNACIIAYEKMNFYAYISLVEVFLKLLIVYAIIVIPFDKLIVYSALLLLISIIIFLCYKLYCNYNYELSKFTLVRDFHSFSELLNFSGFSLLGNAANMASTQGVNMILNVFSGVVANASVGISNQVNAGVYSFISNFQVAFNPQIVKTYARNEPEELKKLICQTSRFSFFLLYIISIPVILYCDKFLSIWLVNVPEYAVDFARWTLLSSLITTLEEPLWVTVQASGSIKKYQIICSILISTDLLFAYLILAAGCHPVYVFVSKLGVNLMLYLYRYLYVKGLISIDNHYYFREVIKPIISVVSITLVITFVSTLFATKVFFMTGGLILMNSMMVYLFGMTKNEKTFILSTIKKKLHAK